MHTTTGLLVAGEGQQGWRSGRPLEDPDKMKRWGFVSAKPSEHLIHVRRGKLTDKSGQGASCFKWPWDSVAIVPTSLQRLSFRADQVTAEKVGVEVVGLAVYRIADPLLAFRVLNFSYPERAQQKLEETLTAMFVGGTRRIVATLSVEDCLKKRKSALAEQLLREIGPVVGGEGRPEDSTDQGWGVVVDTIEIQEVRVLSESVFTAMQAPFRAHVERQAREARAIAEQAIAEREAACRRETELALLTVERELEQGRADAERQRIEATARNMQRQAELEFEAVREQSERATQQTVRAAELATLEAEAQLAAHGHRLAAQEHAAELERASSFVAAELGRLAAEVERDRGIAAAHASLEQATAALRHAEAEARLELARNLPQVAEALGQALSEAKLTHIGAGESPFAQMAAALAALLQLARDGA